ncbi:MAG: stage II sporulation protein M [Verrucomicrobiales bacterium]|nr:stage II sporulation protein M [Verrucomicrobiales bacterium]
MSNQTLADTLQPVELAEGVTVHIRVAGPTVRCLAWLIDLLVTILVYVVASIVLGMMGIFTDQSAIIVGVMLLAMFLFNWFYNVFFEMGKHAATPGQRSMGLKVTAASGAPVRLPQSLIRNLLRTIDFMPACYLTGLVSCLSTRRFQRLGDLVADTVVVYAEERRKMVTPEFQVNVESAPPPVALSREEQAALLQFLERAPGWSDARRLELADVVQPLTRAPGAAGLRRLCGMGLWLMGRSGGAAAGMNATEFERENDHRWQRYESVLDELAKGKNLEDTERLPTLFRQICHDLSVARHRMYGPKLVERLNALALGGYRELERRVSMGGERAWRLLAVDFPQAVREEWRLFWLSSLLFWGPFLLLLFYTPHEPEWAMRLLGSEGMLQMEAMYGEGTSPQDYMRKEFGSNFAMFAFYIFNNVGIGLRTFASGLAFGIGAIFTLLFNGLYIGAAAGYVQHACNPETFWSFVSGHSAPELLGIVISGAAGMRMGFAILNPRSYSRRTALVVAGRRALVLLLGAVFLISCAAVIEGFWSATPTPPWMRYTVGAGVWLAVVSYLLLAGRRAAGDEA